MTDSYCRRTCRFLTLATLTIVILSFVSLESVLAQGRGRPASDGPVIEVRFKADALPNARGKLMSSSLRQSIARVERLMTLEEGKLRALRAQAERKSGRAMPVLEAWYRIVLKEGTDVDAFLAELRQLDFVEHADREPEPAPPPSMPITFGDMLASAMDHVPTPLFEALQGYLDPAPGGIDARYAWNFPGGNGAGFSVFDIEYDWNRTHEDLSKLAGVTILMPAGHTQRSPFGLTDRNHGTAVMGELIGDNDDKGVTGISWGAGARLAAAATFDSDDNARYVLADAILLSVAAGNPGDVILIEQQTCVCDLTCPGDGDQTGLGPSEWDQSVFDATLTATSLGYVVVAAAGNGSVNLDQAGCDGRFDRNVRDSGAIIVGGGSSAARNRMDFSSFGSRIDLQGWGENVMTTGYGTHYTRHDAPNDQNFWYRRNFAGTSSASPIVSGAALNLQGINFASTGTLLTPAQIRTILADTGTDGGTGWGSNVPRLPNLRAAIASIINVPPVADAGLDQTLECECYDGAEVTLDGSGSFDDNGDALTYTWRRLGNVIATGATPTVTLPLGVHSITLTVTDPGGLSDSDTVEITVEDTTDPVVTLLGDDPITLECGVDSYVEYGATIVDLCDAAPSLVIDASEVDTETVGIYDVDYTGTDASDNSVTETRTVNVVDTTPPTITVNTPPAVFWAPNHQYRTIALVDLDIEVEDFCDQTLTADDVVIVSVTSDEPENATGNGDGNTFDDIVIGETCNVVQLRAERAGGGNGRVYTLRLELMDASGNVGFTHYEVHVPHDQRPGSLAIADAPQYSVSADACVPVYEGMTAANDGAPEIRVNDTPGAVPSEMPATFAISQNHPNPFNPVTTIAYALPEASLVRLSVFNMLGQEVARLVDDVREAGMHEARFDASGLPSGMYVYSISAGGFQAARTMVLLK
jgi:hypothetical protein